MSEIHSGMTVSLIVTILSLLHTAAGLSTSACFNANKSLDIDCGTGYMVYISKSFYGYSPTGQCGLGSGQSGCTMDDQSSYPCVGQKSCSINLPTGQWGVHLSACGQRSNYFQVEYNCVLASSVIDICQNKQLKAQTGYIMTPNYPANYNKPGDCTATIEVNPNQKLLLHIIHMDLEAKGKSDCADLLYFNDKLRSITVCGQRADNSYNMHSNYLHIELRSGSRGHSKGFWLYYQAVPPLNSSLQPPQGADGSATASSYETGQPQDMRQQDLLDQGLDGHGNTSDDKMATVPLSRNVSSSGKQLPFAAIAGGVIGTLSLILAILLILLFLKWYRERKYYKAEKILEIRNPAFRSSNDFQESPQSSNSFYS